MLFEVILQTDEDGCWVVECPSIPGCFSQGRTREEAVENIKDAIKGCLEARADHGMPLFLETAKLEIPLPTIEARPPTTERA